MTDDPSVLVVEAEVIRPADAVPPAGVVHALQVDEYAVLRVVAGRYEDPVLYAAREAGTPFAAGDLIRLALSPTLPADATPFVTAPIEVNRYGLYYVLEFERLGTTARRSS